MPLPVVIAKRRVGSAAEAGATPVVIHPNVPIPVHVKVAIPVDRHVPITIDRYVPIAVDRKIMAPIDSDVVALANPVIGLQISFARRSRGPNRVVTISDPM